jgi:AraC family transcriptional regulator of adaptative response / DNA-3-methyladenine glycosylase II
VNFSADQCYEVVKARDARFDGLLFVGVSTTGVYCRPVCPVRTPGRDRCSFFRSAAAAEAAGFRPCLRCRPELSPGRAPIDSTQRLATAALTRIEAGALSSGGVTRLAAELGVSTRQLGRAIEAEYGVSPLALAQTRRLLLAKQLLTDTSLKVIDVAFASGFTSVRQFNRQFRSSYRMNPRALRKTEAPASERFTLQLGYREPLAWRELIQFLAARAAPQTEQASGDRYVRSVRIGQRCGVICARPMRPGVLAVEVSAALLPVLAELCVRLRRSFDLGANPSVIQAALTARRELLPELTEGLRVPGAFDGFELALRAVLGQRVSVRAATTLYGRFVDTFGAALDPPELGLTRLSPRASDVANASLQQLIVRGLPRQRAEAVRALARASADGTVALDPPCDFERARAQLRELPGIGAWTAEYIALRGLGDPDAFPHFDLGLLRAAKLHDPAELLARAQVYRPWRGYAAMQLWHSDTKGA